ncbi:hypothetical protein [Nonomuraea sp. SYSU D8015]|uniref:hypothetical protein n=1 Tax=Nonomuraea sp. SYSU D8015 TaxID=2593644 RepID=UPI0016603D40|nr:hypothetical protein [Nonomuraea sp. SYSU D8015]
MDDDYRQRCTDAAMKAWGEQAVLCDHSQIIPIGSIVNAVIAVRDQDVETLRSENEDLRKRAELAEAAIVRVIANIKTSNLEGECPPDPSEWQRGYWACATSVIGTAGAPYVDAAIDAIKRARERRG